MSESDDGFVSRWSRLKRRPEPAEEIAARPEVPLEEATPPAVTEAEAAPDSDEIVRNLPDIETLTKESDFTAFLQDGVPEELRKRALRHLWRLSPVFATLDGLNDYDLDYTDAAVAVKGVLKTLYQVGKGMPEPAKPEEETAEELAAGESDSAEAGPQAAADDGKVKDVPVEDEVERVALTADTAESMPPDPGDNRQAEQSSAALSPPRGSAAQRRWGRFST